MNFFSDVSVKARSQILPDTSVTYKLDNADEII